MSKILDRLEGDEAKALDALLYEYFCLERMERSANQFLQPSVIENWKHPSAR